jgi:PAS domain S-box-containing protein
MVSTPFPLHLAFSILPWVLLAAAIAAGLWRRRRDEAELAVLRQAGERLAATQTVLRRISQAVESTGDAIGIGDMEGNSLYHNRAHLDMFGYTVEELNAVPETGVLFADKRTAQEILTCAKSGRSWRGETDVLSKTGQRIPAFVRADIIRDETGHPVGVYGVFADISERRRVERLLEEERERLKVTLQSIGDGVITTDVGGCVVLMNPVAEKLTGWTQAAAAGYLLQEILPLRDETNRQPLENPALRMLRSGRRLLASQTFVLVAADGSERFIMESSAFIRSGGEGVAGVVQVIRDVTDERKRSAEAARAGKLESLGLLAGGIAHDFNNLLAAMAGNLTLAQLEPGVPESVLQRLGAIDKIVWRARDLTQGLKTFAKGGTTTRKLTSLAGLVRESAGLALEGATAELTCELAPDLLPVAADPSQLGQVLHNIVLNAVQAMPPGGRIAITGTNLGAGADPAVREGETWVRISIADNGPGISPEALPKIFDPFFTTKAKGTGLGLATSHSIIEQHGGRLRVDSTVGQGTTFHLLLPGARPEVVAAAAAGRRRILLVEDEAAVRDSIELMLTRLGFATVPAHDAGEACRRYREALDQGQRFDAVLLDLSMPAGPEGGETALRLREMDPGLCAVVISGDDGPAMAEPKSFGFAAALPKPFKLEELDAVLKRLLA